MKQTVISALRVSGSTLLNYFGNAVEFKVKESQSSIVTEIDLKSDSIIVGMISERFPDHNLISEESGFLDRNSRYTWVIDPLDGTSNFASSIPWFGVLITILEESIPIMAGAYLPVPDILYFAEKGKGVTANGRVLRLPERPELKNSLIAFSVDYTDDELLLNHSLGIYKNIVKSVRNIRSTNSLVDFLYVAEGKFGGCINLFTKIWDISGLGLIVSEAGGVLKDIEGNELSFIPDENISEKNFAVMAGHGSILDELINKVLKV
jgi:myo-inositol-1(or 4)-monophosphatase